MEEENKQTETTGTSHSPADIELENEVAEMPTTSDSPTHMEEECHDAERPSTFQRTKQFIKKYSRLLQLLVFFIKETVDTTLDWLLFNELNTQDEGLVFGAVDSWLLYVLFTFCCIGTVLTLLDISNRVHELRTGSPFLHTYIPEILTALLEDIPQLALGFYILKCRGQMINSLARVKAVFLLVGSALYLLCTSITLVVKLSNNDGIGSFLKFVLFLLCAGITSLSICILWSTSGEIGYAAFDPFDILKNKTKRDIYFSRVGIYINTGGLQIDDLSNRTKWIKFFEINDILGNDDISVQIITDPVHVRLKTMYGRIQKNDTDICYRVNGTFEDEILFTEAADCALSNGTTWYYRFKYIHPSMRHLLGDIQYNVRKTETGSCDNIAGDRIPDLKYFRVLWNQNLIGHLYGPTSHYSLEWNSNSSLWERVYLYQKAYKWYYAWALGDIEYVWRTGSLEHERRNDESKKRPRCVNTNVSPHPNLGITVPCYL